MDINFKLETSKERLKSVPGKTTVKNVATVANKLGSTLTISNDVMLFI